MPLRGRAFLPLSVLRTFYSCLYFLYTGARMRAIIDADHLPTAVRYYTMFPGEPSQQLANYISITSLDQAHNLTLTSLLGMLETYATGGEKELMIVLHSNPDGLLLPIGTGGLAGINADRSVLKIIELASDAFGLLDDSKNPNMAVNDAFLRAWMDFFSSSPNVNTSSVSQASGVAAKCAEAARLGQLWVHEASRAMHTTETALRDLAARADRVRQSGFTRLEFRSCRLGAGAGLKEVAGFFGAMSFAPTEFTFYVHQPIQMVANQATLNRTARGLGNNSRRFTAANAAAGPSDDIAFAIQVTRLAHARYSSRMFAISEQAVFNWVSRFISRLPTGLTVNNAPVPLRMTGHTLAHELPVAGFWTMGRAAKPFIFPSEAEYPGYIEGQF
jgi:hypothetical protein